jgi:hypothetical protein
VAAWALWALALLGLASVPWFDHLARQAGRPELTQLNASTIPYLLAFVVAATVGAVLASRLPRHPVGWLLLALGLSVTGSGVADGYARYGLVARPWALPAARWVAIYSPATTLVGLALVGFVQLLTPTGSLPSPGWRWWAWVAAAGPVVFVLALTVGPGLVIPPYGSAVEAVTIPALAGAVLVGIVGASPSPSVVWWSEPGRWWRASAAPEGGAPAAALAGPGGRPDRGGGGRRRGRHGDGGHGGAVVRRRRLPGAAAAGDRGGGPALPAV